MQKAKKIAHRITIIFVGLFILTLPFSHDILPNIGEYFHPFFAKLAKWVGDNIFHISTTYTHELLSDSTGLYIHTFNLLIISIIGGLIWGFFDKQQTYFAKIQTGFYVFISYYLSFYLLHYGFHKIFKTQFYLPEPNTLFTNVGEMTPDILYWTTLGSSYMYSVFTGFLEVIPAVLLWFKSTRLLGACIALGVLVNVFMINMGFDISVKIFSGFLCFLAALLVLPYLPNLYRFFVVNERTFPTKQPSLSSSTKAAFLKSLVIGLILFEVLVPYFKNNTFNDDKVARPHFHGAYEIQSFMVHGEILAPLVTDKRRWYRFFIHRQGYFITQAMDGQMQDYTLQYDLENQQLILRDYAQQKIILNYIYSAQDSTFVLKGSFYNKPIEVHTKMIDKDKIPLLQPYFHWTIDGY